VSEARKTAPPRPSSHLVVSRSCRIPLDEMEWRFSASGGPGGQHANTSNTKAEVRFDVATAPSLGPRQRARLLERQGPMVRVVASDERSQVRNRDLALERTGRPPGRGSARRDRPGAHPAPEVRLGQPPGRQAQAVRDQAAAGPTGRRLTVPPKVGARRSRSGVLTAILVQGRSRTRRWDRDWGREGKEAMNHRDPHATPTPAPAAG